MIHEEFSVDPSARKRIAAADLAAIGLDAGLVNESPGPADVAANLGRLMSSCMDAVFAEVPTADPRGKGR